ncbi:MAG: regulatory signaling modulator protein AmpE, partial [Enterobacteriaceae bacterium]
GELRQFYRDYLLAAQRGDREQAQQMAERLIISCGHQPESGESTLSALQKTLIWINYRFYLAPLFWLLLGILLTPLYGPLFLAGYAFLRAYQAWLIRNGTVLQRTQSGIDMLLHLLDWIPTRLSGLVYGLFGRGERALPAWFASLGDLRTPAWQVLSHLTRFSLAKEPDDKLIDTPVAAVELARRATLLVVLLVAILTIVGIIF